MKKIPRVFVNNIEKINNNKEVYYSFKKEEVNNEFSNPYIIRNKINELFKLNDFVYKHKFHIKTNDEEKEVIIISKSYDYLLTLNGEKIYIDNIIDIY